MRVQIREQLSVFTLLSTLFALAVVAVATWITAHSFTLDIRSSRLSLTASLKASQLASNLALMESTVAAMTTRLRVQAGLDRYINGTTTADNWAMATEDLTNVLATSQRAVLTFQTLVYPRPNVTTTHLEPVMNVSNPSIPDNLNFQKLYPNISYVRGSGGHNGIVPRIRDTILNTNTAILQGPVQYNASLFLVSITLPVMSNTTATDIIGWLTAVIDARLIFEVVTSAVGLDTTGIVLLVGPVENYNRFPGSLVSRTPPFINDTDILSQIPLHFLLPPQQDNATGIRHPLSNVTFTAPQFPSVLSALTQQHPVLNNASSNINTKNEAGQTIAVGYALPPTNLCDWVLLLEEERSEVLEPISHLRNILLACVFITAAVMALTTWILAHFFVRPIRRLREATEATVEPLGYDSSDDAMPRSSSSASISEKRPGLGGVRHSSHSSRKSHRHRTTAEFWSFLGFHNRRQTTGPRAVGERARVRVPSKVKTPKRYWIRDELTELTETFNEMSDELYLQYAKLEERVKARTSELELSKKAAEAANESKTLFIANISHELKSPLNAILGMAAICMQERDLQKIQQSLSIIYKSGDLLHNLLTDLLTFSKNQVGHHLTLDEKEFSVKDIAVQLNAIFDAQAKESNITLDVVFEGVCDAVGNMETTTDKIYGPAGSGRVKDMYVWGDQQRILQVAINLLSNSLKFTPEGGSVVMRIRCSGEYERSARPSNASIGSRSLASREKTDSILVSEGAADTKIDTATQINAISPRRRSSLAPSSIASMSHSELLAPPPNAKTFVFEFEVEDTGPGIPEHLQEQIFEPFVQGDLRLTKKFGGTGLGLSIVSQLAKLMNGIIRVESEVGAGSRFTLRIPLKYVQSRRDSFATSYNEMMGTDNIAVVDDHDANDEAQTGVPDSHESQSRAAVRRRTPSLTFDADRKPRLVGLSQPYFSNATPPLTSPAADPMASAAESSKKRNRVRVLVAEDNKVNQEVVLRMLRLEDIFDVHLAKDGQEAFEKVRESMEAGEPYQLIFMDVQMPNLDGRESTRQIRELGYEAPIVALTAFADEINQKACMECGMDYFLAKPIRRPALRHVLRTYCPTITEEDERSNEASSISGRSRASASEDGRAGKMKRLASGLTMSEERTNRLEVIYSSDTGRDPAAQANGEFERTPSSKETA